MIETSVDGIFWNRVGDGVSTATGVKIPGLTGKTAYTIRIAAVTDVDTGAWLTTRATTK